MRRRQRYVIVISRSTLLLIALVILAAATVAGARRLSDATTRRVRGVKPGVTFVGEAVGGMLPEEARGLILRRAPGLEVAPQDAYLGPDGQVVAEREGRKVDVDATLGMLQKAAPQMAVGPVYKPLFPRIRAAMYSDVRIGNSRRQYVSLMFNVAWGEEVLPELLRLLEREGVRCTFFIDGRWAGLFPGLVREIVAQKHEVATHGELHLDPTTFSSEEVKRLIIGGVKKLEAAGVAPVPLFAPPFGAVNPAVCRASAELGYWTVMWSLDTIDWRRPSPDVIIDRVLSNVQKGALVLMHPTPPTLSALPAIIAGLRRLGYEFVPVTAQLPKTS